VKITSAVFVKSAFDRKHWVTDGLPEIAFLGRSNVGKSSLINALLQRKGLAKASNTPGRTQSINFFLINELFYFVDLPGYGYAKVSKTKRSDWGRMAEEYLSDRRELALSIQLVDARHAPTELDKQLFEWLVFNQKEHLIAATKSDKLSNNQLTNQIRSISENLRGNEIIACSVRTRKGCEQILRYIQSAVEKT
jgi:GTP-binding protein